MTDIEYISKVDGSRQHMLFHDAGSAEKKPLLVGLHQWSSGYLTDKISAEYLRLCESYGWAFIFPNFRGPNRSPDAMGSSKAVADIADAVEHAKTLCAVDETRIYLAGISGGGHMALLAAALLPDIWAGVTAWVPIFDIADWWQQCSANTTYKKYADMIELSAGGAPLPGTPALEECRKRSASSCLTSPVPFMLDINGGLFDGREGSVPFTHSLKAFNAAAREEDRIPEADIAAFYETQQAPYPTDCADALYGDTPPVFRKVSGSVRVTIFKGGHIGVLPAAFEMLALQER